MGIRLSRTTQRLLKFGALLALGLICAPASYGQDKEQAFAPPPMKFISREERGQLNAAKDVKERLRVSLDLAAAHLRGAQDYTTREQYDAASAELGRYQGIVEDVFKYLAEMDTSRGRVRDLYRRLELSLREDTPRLETIRRVTPAEHSVNVKAAIEFAKDSRTRALNTFYGNTVIRDASPDGKASGAAKTSEAKQPPAKPAQDKQP
ncbi:MAG TPA: hypothetical protein VF507_04895 [Pyrinomonadaceae bacterium]|jgi:hypothetical protein